MIIKVKSIRQLAKDVNIPEELVERHIDGLCEFAFRISKRERKFCQSRLRAWHFSKDIGKCEVIQVLDEDTDYDLI